MRVREAEALKKEREKSQSPGPKRRISQKEKERMREEALRKADMTKRIRKAEANLKEFF
jgi:hypothetical protein